jgi:type II restriction/modification system DNA methylase subunit YeeA
MRSGLGDHDVETLFDCYRGRVPPEADLVTYWFEKARTQVEAGQTKRVGLVATNSIRGGANRRVLDRIVSESCIFEAWSDEPWVIDGASVRVSLICFGSTDDVPRFDGEPVSHINADLTAGALDLTKAQYLAENRGVSFMGDTKGGAFDVPGELARAWLQLPTNPNGRRNAEVLRPWHNGQDITRRSADKWVIDFGWEMSEPEASLFEAPFEYIKARVFPERSKNRRESYRMHWWRHVEPRPALMGKLAPLERYIVTPTVAKHRVFVWLQSAVTPDHQLIAITRDDDIIFGILHSRFHELWALRLGTSLEDRPRYTPSTTFETFPFPEGLTPDIPAAEYADDPRAQKIAAAAKRLNELRNNWLNPPDLIMRVPEVAKGYPDRILSKNGAAAQVLKQRTLTNLYNERPAWLENAHRELDDAVAEAYGWKADMSDDEMLTKLLALNLARAKEDPRQ